MSIENDLKILELQKQERLRKERLYLLYREKLIRRARVNFWVFCQLLEPQFYKKDRWHLKKLCNTLQLFYEKKLTSEKTKEVLNNLMINIPPRHGKSRTLVNFCAWILGVNPDEKILNVGSGDDLANDFSRFVRDLIMKTKLTKDNPEIIYNDIFPKTKIKKGNSAVEKWALHGKFFTFLSAGYNSNKITGKGFSLIICDDLISGEKVALNPTALERINNFVFGTLPQRKEQDCLTIFNMTRWSDYDPCGVMLGNPKTAKYWYVLKIPVRDKETKQLICPDIFNEQQYEQAQDEVSPLVFSANYYQEPITLKGSIYNLQTYETIPEDAKSIYSFCDTADGGGDSLSAPIGKLWNNKETKKTYIFLTNWLHTTESMDITEDKYSDMLIEERVDKARIESNNAGGVFARNIKEKLRKKGGKTFIDTFAQRNNKEARILTNYSNINKYVLVPVDFWIKCKDAAKALYSFQKDKKNKHDDAPDSLTGLYEMLGNEKASSLGGWN